MVPGLVASVLTSDDDPPPNSYLAAQDAQDLHTGYMIVIWRACGIAALQCADGCSLDNG